MKRLAFAAALLVALSHPPALADDGPGMTETLEYIDFHTDLSHQRTYRRTGQQMSYQAQFRPLDPSEPCVLRYRMALISPFTSFKRHVWTLDVDFSQVNPNSFQRSKRKLVPRFDRLPYRSANLPNGAVTHNPHVVTFTALRGAAVFVRHEYARQSTDAQGAILATANVDKALARLAELCGAKPDTF